MPPETAETDDLTRQFAAIVRQICRVMDAEKCTVYLHNSETGEIWSRFMAEGAGGTQEIRLRVGEGIAGRVMETGQILNIADAKSDTRHVGRFDQAGFVTQSILCAPLMNAEGERIGVVQVLNKRGGAFTRADEILLDALNTQVAIALENARLAADLGMARKTEADLTHQLAEKHRELQNAFLKLESAKAEAETSLRRIGLARVGAVVGAVLLFLAIALVSIRGGRGRTVLEPAGTTEATGPQIVTVEKKQTRNSIPLESSFAPLRTVNVVAALGGVISGIHFHYGQRVEKGDLLLEIVSPAEEVAQREAEAQVIRASERVQELETWTNSSAAKDARRALVRAQNQKRDAERRAAETARLFEKGIVGANENEAAKRELESASLEATAAEEALEKTLSQGNERQLQLARMALTNAQAAEARTAARRAAARVRAPISGVVLLPPAKEGAAQGTPAGPELRSEVVAGSLLLQIGDLSGLSLSATVDEIEISQIQVGQKVLAGSYSLPDLKLTGTVAVRASQGRWVERSRGRRFDVVAEIPELPKEWADRVLLGMSASMEILLQEGEPKLVLPVAAVHLEGDSAWVERIDPATGEPGRHTVRVGPTTVDGVEITKGLAEGDKVMVR